MQMWIQKTLQCMYVCNYDSSLFKLLSQVSKGYQNVWNLWIFETWIMSNLPIHSGWLNCIQYVRMCAHYIHCIHTGYTVRPCTTSSTQKIGPHNITASPLTSTRCGCLYWGSEGLLFKSACCLQEARHTFTMHHMSCHLEPPHIHTLPHIHSWT